MTKREELEEKERELENRKEEIVNRIKEAINELKCDVRCYYTSECDDIENIRIEADDTTDTLRRLTEDFEKICKDLKNLEQEFDWLKLDFYEFDNEEEEDD